MEGWSKRKRPLRLEKRFEFADYQMTRDFLDSLGEYSEKINYFPDISFGKTYVNITLKPNENNSDFDFTEEELKIASDIDQLLID